MKDGSYVMKDIFSFIGDLPPEKLISVSIAIKKQVLLSVDKGKDKPADAPVQTCV